MSLNLFTPDAGMAAPSTTTLASSGGLLVNIDSATGTLTTATSGNQPPVEDEKFGIRIRSTGSSVGTSSGQFVTGAGGTGDRVFRYGVSGLTNTGATYLRASNGINAADATVSVGDLSKTYIPIKPSTKYKFRCRINVLSFTAVGTSPGISFSGNDYSSAGSRLSYLGSATTYTAPTGGFVWDEFTFTSHASAAYFTWIVYFLSGNGSVDIDVNSMSLEEVVEPVANSLTSSSPSLVSFTAVGSTDNIDQSQLTGTTGSVIGNFGGLSYMFSQSFTPTKSKLTGVYLYKRANTGTPTGNLKVDIRTNSAGDPSSTILATYTMPLATYNALTTNAEFLVNLPCNLTAGTLYHIVISDTATEASGNYFNIGGNSAGGYTGGDSRSSTNGGTTWAVAGTADLYFKTLYYKPTTNFKASQNNSTVSISADEDGFLEGAVLNLTNGTYTYSDNYTNELKTIGSVYAVNTPYLFVDTANSRFFVNEAMSTPTRPDRQPIFKVDMGGVANSMTIQATIRQAKIQYSYDNITYFDGVVQDTASEVVSSFTLTPNQRIVYLKFVRGTATAGTFCYFKAFSITATIDTSSLSTLRNYPTNKDIIKQYSTTLGSATTSATYRATKWGFPAIEYLPLGVSSSNLVGRYEFLSNGNDTSGNGNSGTPTGVISYGSIADRNYAYLAGDRNGTAATGSRAEFQIGNKMNFNHTTDFSWSTTFTVYSNPPADTSGILGSTFSTSVHIGPTGTMFVGLRGSSTVNYSLGTNYWATRYGETHTVGLSFSTTEQKYYVYLDGVLQNAGGTTSPTTITTTANWYIGDNAITSGLGSSCQKRIYHAAVFSRTLSTADHLAIHNSVLTSQALDIDTTATGSTVAFSELGTSYTTVADGASLAITSTSTPSIFVKANITANRLYLSSNDYNASSDKDGSMKQGVVYQVKSISTQSRNTKLSNKGASLKLTYG